MQNSITLFRSKRRNLNPLRIQAIQMPQQQNPSPSTPIQQIHSDQQQLNYNSTSNQQIKCKKHPKQINNWNQHKTEIEMKHKLP